MTEAPDGSVRHATVRLDEAVVDLSSPHPGQFEPATNLPARHVAVLACVEDVDAVFERARAAGADVEYEPEDMPYGQRECGVRDLDGTLWSFGTPL